MDLKFYNFTVGVAKVLSLDVRNFTILQGKTVAKVLSLGAAKVLPLDVRNFTILQWAWQKCYH